MSEVHRFMAPGPWITRDLKECVRASDYDALAEQLEECLELLRVMPGCGLSAYDLEVWKKRRSALLALWNKVHE